jgi:hypothetical protein
MGNRYQPPRARVADTGAMIRPRSINVALASIGLVVLVECYHQVMNLSEVSNGERSGLSWVVDWIWVAAVIIAGFFIARGRNWARWVLGIITLHVIYEYLDARLFISSFGEGIEEFVAPFSLWILPMSSLFAVAATILVFGPGRGWFAARG